MQIVIKLDHMDIYKNKKMFDLMYDMSDAITPIEGKRPLSHKEVEGMAQVTPVPNKPEPVTPVAQVTPVPNKPEPVTPVAPVTTTAPTATALPPTTAVPTAAPAYNLDQISKAGVSLIDAGKQDALLQLLSKYGVQAVTALKPESYGAFATELRALGAQI